MNSYRTPKPTPLKKLPRVEYKLSGSEMLFFPKNYDPTPKSSTSFADDLVRKRNYLEKIQKMSPDEQRLLRAKRDARYLHKNANESIETKQDEKQFCYDHLVGRCNAQNICGRWHQMRHPRFFGVCKFYISDACVHGDLCSFMHEEFPCRFYYLDIKHPKSMDESNCRFKHGGPLPQRMYRYFKKQIELWAKDITKNESDKFDQLYLSFLDKFETKHAALEQEHCTIEKKESRLSETNNDGCSFGNILSSKQIKSMTERGITTLFQINQIPIDDLLEYGLNMDQIYKITTSTYTDTSQMSSETMPHENCTSNEQIQLTNNFVCENSEMNEDSLRGFSDVELKTAEDILQTKQHVFGIVYYAERIAMPSNDDSITMNAMETETEEENMIKTKNITEIEAEMKPGTQSDEQDEKMDPETSQSQNSIVAVINKVHKTRSFNSDDSDDEFGLIINEEM